MIINPSAFQNCLKNYILKKKRYIHIQLHFIKIRKKCFNMKENETQIFYTKNNFTQNSYIYLFVYLGFANICIYSHIIINSIKDCNMIVFHHLKLFTT